LDISRAEKRAVRPPLLDPRAIFGRRVELVAFKTTGCTVRHSPRIDVHDLRSLVETEAPQLRGELLGAARFQIDINQIDINRC
jgi:hypothetical protein